MQVVRIAPGADRFALLEELSRRGPALVVVPAVASAVALACRFERAGIPVAVLPGQWARAARGGITVVGARAAAWGPAPEAGTIIVLDEHDEGLKEERAPTWHARDVCIERARRAGARCVLVSPCPSVEAMVASTEPVTAPSRAAEREGWAPVEVVDLGREDPLTGRYPPRLAELVRGDGRVVCVLNRTGGVRLLACNACRQLAQCEVCGGASEQGDKGLGCRRCGATRPRVCTHCGTEKFRALRVGTARARDELAALVGEPVTEVTASTDGEPSARVLVGTEAVLHRVDRADVVVFLDFDLELLAPRFRAGEQALALLARAARITGGRRRNGRVVVQTRLPEHDVIAAALHADPGRFGTAELARRRDLALPPFAAFALGVRRGRRAVRRSPRRGQARRRAGPGRGPLACTGRGPRSAVRRTRRHAKTCGPPSRRGRSAASLKASRRR